MTPYAKFVFFIVIIVILGAVVYAVSGQIGGGSFSAFSNFFKEHRDLLPTLPGGLPEPGSGPAPVKVGYGTPSGGSAPTGQPSGGLGGSPSQPGLQPGTQPPAGFTIAQLSPYYKQVSISSVSAARSTSDISQFALQADYSLASPVDVTGWVLKGRRGELARIPQASPLYQPSGAAPDSDILLEKGGTVYVYGTRSPIGANFRLNKCTGYLNGVYAFSPQLPQNCPSPYNRSETVNFSAACQDFINSIGSCRTPTSAELNQYSVYNNGACRAFLDRFSYTGCYSRFRGDSDFSLNEWRTWIVSGILFDDTHDHLTLYDRNGLLVNEYIY